AVERRAGAVRRHDHADVDRADTLRLHRPPLCAAPLPRPGISRPGVPRANPSPSERRAEFSGTPPEPVSRTAVRFVPDVPSPTSITTNRARRRIREDHKCGAHHPGRRVRPAAGAWWAAYPGARGHAGPPRVGPVAAGPRAVPSAVRS